MALHAAERFIKEMRPKSTTVGLWLQVLSSYTLLGSRKKADVEQALQKFVEIASTEVRWYMLCWYVATYVVLLQKDFIPGIANAHMILKQTPKARNQLKRISKLQWNTSVCDIINDDVIMCNSLLMILRRAGYYQIFKLFTGIRLFLGVKKAWPSKV